MLSTNHLRLIGKLLFNHLDHEKIQKEYDFDEKFLRNLRDDLCALADKLDETGEVEIELSKEPKYEQLETKEDKTKKETDSK